MTRPAFIDSHFTVPGHRPSSHTAVLEEMVESAPRGSTIRIDVYLFSDSAIARLLIKASRRGVIVHVATQDLVPIPKESARRFRQRVAVVEILRGLRSPSSLTLGQSGHAGSGSRKSVFDHNKLFTFSTTKHRGTLRRRVVVISSGNLTDEAWRKHQATLIVADARYYGKAKEYWSAQAEALPVAPPFPVPSDAYHRTWPENPKDAHTNRLYFFPRVGDRDPLAKMLDGSGGVGLYPEHRSSAGRQSSIRVAVAVWTTKRDIAAAVNAHLRGGRARVIVLGRKGARKRHLGIQIIRDLRAHAGSTERRNVEQNLKIGWLRNEGDTYFHGKYFLIEGPWGDPQVTSGVRSVQWRKIVVHGTRNWTHSGFRTQDNMAFKTMNERVFDQFSRNHDLLYCMSAGLTATSLPSWSGVWRSHFQHPATAKNPNGHYRATITLTETEDRAVVGHYKLRLRASRYVEGKIAGTLSAGRERMSGRWSTLDSPDVGGAVGLAITDDMIVGHLTRDWLDDEGRQYRLCGVREQ